LTVDDYALFLTNPAELLDRLRTVATATPGESELDPLLTRMGLLKKSALTAAGNALFKTAWVLRKESEALRQLGLAMRALLPVQVIEQELLHFGAIPEEGALELLKLHRAAPLDLPVDTARRTFRNLAQVGLVVYSSKFKTVRAVAPPAEEARAGEERRLAAMVSPKTPFLNVVRLRRILRSMTGTVWWADRHFGARAFEELAEELDSERVSEVRIVSGAAENVVTPRSLKDYERFRAEMAVKGVAAEWRVDNAASDWHDRWLVGDSGAWNVPPVNTLFKNDHSELLPTDARPPLEEWWARSTPR
jgi:hypothetical protein